MERVLTAATSDEEASLPLLPVDAANVLAGARRFARSHPDDSV